MSYHSGAYPIDIRTFIKKFTEAKIQDLIFHQQLDTTGGIKETIDRAIDSKNALFGVINLRGKKKETPFEKRPVADPVQRSLGGGQP